MMPPDREAYFRAQAENGENADPMEIREMCNAIRAQRQVNDKQTQNIKVWVKKTERLRKALLFYTAGTGAYDGWTVKQLLEEMDAHV